MTGAFVVRFEARLGSAAGRFVVGAFFFFFFGGCALASAAGAGRSTLRSRARALWRFGERQLEGN